MVKHPSARVKPVQKSNTMKRFSTLAALLLAVCTVASAQDTHSKGVFVGLSASHLSHIKDTYAGVELGYDFNEHFSVGASSIFKFPETGKDFGLNTFLRYSIVDFHHFVPFVDLKCGYGNRTIVNPVFEVDKYINHQYSIGLMPGIKYSFSDRLSLFARFGSAEYVKRIQKELELTVRSHAYELNFNLDTIRLGIAYKIPINNR